MTDVPADTAPIERIDKPWGEELILSRSPHRVVKTLRIRPHQRLSLQYHRSKHETLLLLGGAARLTVGRERGRLRSAPMRDGIPERIDAGAIHRLTAGPAGAEILEVAQCTPSDRDTDAEDIVRLADDYGRADHPPAS